MISKKYFRYIPIGIANIPDVIQQGAHKCPELLTRDAVT